MCLTELQKKNPGLALYDVRDPAFISYGRLVDADTADLVARMEKIPMPAQGSRYVPREETLEDAPLAALIREELFGGVATQIGYCWGYNDRLNALEWHTCSEFNLAATDLVLLLALRSDLCENRLHASDVRGFFVPRGTLIEVYGTSLHFCPCQVEDGGFRCLVALSEGTNTDLPAPAKDPYLFRRNKWLIAHEDNAALIARGVRPGIDGENYILHR